MAKKFEEVRIPGVEGYFNIVQLPGTASYYLFLDILGVVAPSAAKALGGGSAGLSIKDVDLEQLGAGLAGFFERATRAKVESITATLFSTIEHVTTEKHRITTEYLDTLFQGNPLGILLLQKEALRVNYQSFFAALGPQLRRLFEQAKAQAEGAKRPTSAGPSGASLSSNASPV